MHEVNEGDVQREAGGAPAPVPASAGWPRDSWLPQAREVTPLCRALGPKANLGEVELVLQEL